MAADNPRFHRRPDSLLGTSLHRQRQLGRSTGRLTAMRHFRQTRAVTGARRWLLIKISLQPLQAIGDSC
jgi:hypothetical protein